MKIGDKVIARTGLHHSHPNTRVEVEITDIKTTNGVSKYAVFSKDHGYGWFDEDHLMPIQDAVYEEVGHGC